MPPRGWVAFAVTAALQILWAVTRPLGIYDETWFLQVARRVAEGETLYRDVYFNTTPLSMYLTLLATEVAGIHLLTVRLGVVFSALLGLFTAWKIIDRSVPGDRRPPLLLFALVLVYGNYPSLTPYTPLAVSFFLLTLYGFVVWLDERRDRVLFWSGLAAGLCFATKHNVGVLAAGALGVAVLVTARARHTRTAAIARALGVLSAGFSLVVAAMLLVIAATGGLAVFLEYAFVNKTTYLAVGSAGYVRGLGFLYAALSDPLAPGALTNAYAYFVLAVPPLAIVLAVRWLAAGDREARIRAAAMAIFLLAGCAGTYPRAGAATTYVVPILGTMIVLAWRLGAAPRGGLLRRACVIAAAGWVGIGVAAMVVLPFRRLASDEWRFSRIPHCGGILVRSETEDRLLREAAALRAALPGGEAFIQSIAAGFYYLAADLRNPTPYDMPAVTTFGPHGQRKVIAWIASGRIAHVAVFPPIDPPQVPRELMQAIETRMVPRTRAHGFTVYASARPPTGGAG